MYKRYINSIIIIIIIGCGYTWAFFTIVEFTTVNAFSNVTGFSHFTMVNTDLICCGGKGGRMKVKAKTFIAGISKLCLFS